MAELRWGSATHPGQIRTNNEDAFTVDSGLWAVADGMGGHLAGEVASAYTIDALRTAYADGMHSVDDLVDAVQLANDTIRQDATRNPARRGMGTTVTAIALVDGSEPHLMIANVGDSRTYLWRGGELVPVTIDHSYVQELLMGGEITPDEARTHPRRNIVTRALGIEAGVLVDTWTLPAVQGDRFVLCSDGLVDEVEDGEIASVCAAFDDPQAAAERLVELANDHGGRDNVTVVVLDVLQGVTLEEAAAAMPDPEPIGDDATASDEDDTARINRTLAIPTIVADDPLPDQAAATLPDPTPVSAAAIPPASGEVFIDGQPASAIATATAPAPAPPAASPSPPSRRTSKAMIAFWIAITAIAIVVATVVVMAVTGDDDPAPVTTTTIAATTTAPATSTTTATTAPTTTAATTTVAPGAAVTTPTVPPTQLGVQPPEGGTQANSNDGTGVTSVP